MPVVATIAALLGVVLPDIAIPVGLTCDPVSVAGGTGTSCSEQTVCCENNNY
ncbi:hypothetical protein H0H93_005026, partial [Arthromyces matolae]